MFRTSSETQISKHLNRFKVKVWRPVVNRTQEVRCVQTFVTLQVVILTYLKQIKFSSWLENVHLPIFLLSVCVFLKSVLKIIAEKYIYITYGENINIIWNIIFVNLLSVCSFSPLFCCIRSDSGRSFVWPPPLPPPQLPFAYFSWSLASVLSNAICRYHPHPSAPPPVRSG